MRKVIYILTAVILVGVVKTEPTNQGQQSALVSNKPSQPIFVPATANLITELQLTKNDLLPAVAEVLSYFSLQHATGQVLSGEDLKKMVTSMEVLWLVEYDIPQRGVSVSDAIKMQEGLMETQGWRRIFWNKKSDGSRETLVMIQPPRDGLFVVIAREGPKALRVIAIKTKGTVDTGMTLWLILTFLMRPEQPSSLPVTPSPTTQTDRTEKKETPSEKTSNGK